jgi:predicted ATPase
MQGEASAGVALVRQGLASPDVGPAYLRPHWLAMLAEAVTLMTTTKMWWSEAEMFRLQGALRLRLASPEVPQAEACFYRAIDVARRQQAKALELRAALSLSRLWQQQGRRLAARELLAPIYGWFTEGFDTADLQEAKALLEDLA